MTCSCLLFKKIHLYKNSQLEDNAAFMDKYSRQIGAFGLEAMSKLMNLKVLIVGLRCVHRLLLLGFSEFIFSCQIVMLQIWCTVVCCDG